MNPVSAETVSVLVPTPDAVMVIVAPDAGAPMELKVILIGDRVIPVGMLTEYAPFGGLGEMV